VRNEIKLHKLSRNQIGKLEQLSVTANSQALSISPKPQMEFLCGLVKMPRQWMCHPLPFSASSFFFVFLALSLGHQCSHVALAALVAKWCLANGSWNQPDALVLNKKPFSRLLFHGKPWYGLRSKIAVYLRFVDFIAELCLQFCLNFITRSATERRWAKGKEICGCVAALDWKWMPKPWYELIFEQGCQVEQTSKGSGAWPSQMDICLHGMDIG